MAEYVPKEEEVDDKLGSESANSSLFKSCRLKRKQKLVNNTASQVPGLLFNMNFNKLIRINYLINYIDKYLNVFQLFIVALSLSIFSLYTV